MHLTYSNCLKKHYNDYNTQVLITSHITWFPFELLISELKNKILCQAPEAKLLETSVFGLRTSNNGESLSKSFYWSMLAKLLLNSDFYVYFFNCSVKIFKLLLKFKESFNLADIKIKNIKIGDIVAAEYLRNAAYGNGNLQIDFRFYILTIKYLVVYVNFTNSLAILLKKYRPEEIRFCLQETSFKDEMLRRILINNNIIFEYQFDKFLGKMVLFEFKPNSEGRIFEYTPKLYDVTEKEINECTLSLDKRIHQGTALWTGNITDIDSHLQLDEESLSMIDLTRPIAVLFLHAVADDQFRCGLDCFKSIDDFHKYTIETLLLLGYQCILKPHPGIKSALHPDKSIIDDRYVTDLFFQYGLDYGKTTNSFSRMIHRSTKLGNFFSINPKISIKSISNKMNFIALTHHGNISFEALHLSIPALKYRYCKNREFDFMHSWSDRSSYVDLLNYYKHYMSLPRINFRDSYLTVSTILSRKKKFDDYNKTLYKSYLNYFPDAKINFPPQDAHESALNIEIIKGRYEVDEYFNSYVKLQLNKLLG